MRIRLLLLCLLLNVCSPARSQPADEARHETVNYDSMQAGPQALYAWPGRHVVVLTSNGQLDEPVMKSIVEAFDKAWEFLADATGREPLRDKRTTWRELAIVAVVPSACNETCGRDAHAGIEIRADVWEEFYLGVRDKKVFGDNVFFQMGLCFWFYHEQAIDVDAMKFGFGVWARFAAMEAAGVVGGPFKGHPFEEFRRAVEAMGDLYLADANLSFSNTIGADRGPANAMGLGAADLFASFVMRLLKSGDREFRRQLWREMALRPRNNSREEAVDNLFLAASAAWGESQAALFDQWRWPISAGARAEAEAMFTRAPLGGDGLRGEYFSGDFGELLLGRVDSQVNFEWGDGPAFDKGLVDNFSVRWSGHLMAREAGLYTLGLNVDDGARLWIDGQLVIDQWQEHVGEDLAQVRLPAMRRVAIKVEYREIAQDARLKLLWSSPSLHRQIVPADNLFSQ